MELHHARVVPSNAPALPENALLSPTTDLAETLSSDICQSYNHGHECSGCNLLHVCLRCKHQGHPATDCKYGILRASSGNVGTSAFQSCKIDLKAGNNQKYPVRSVPSLINPPHHSAQAAIKAEYQRRQWHSSRSISKRLLPYWHVEYQTPRYCTYREKIRLKGSKGEKWGDNVEEAFQIGL